jgi:hypothetical protein
MCAFNASTVYPVKTQSVNTLRHARRVGKKPEVQPSPFWQRLVKAWDRQGLPTSQNGVATKLDMSQGSTRRWYTGDGLPDTPQIIQIARLGRCSIHWLLTGEGLEAVNPDQDTADLLRHWAILTPEARRAVLRTARLEHAVQFTGDPEARSAYQKRLQESSPGFAVHERDKNK